MTNKQLEAIFEAWLITGELSEQDSSALQANPEFAERVNIVNTMRSLSLQYQNEPVPSWNKQSTWFEKSPLSKGNWFQRCLVACSLMLMAFVLFNVQVSTSAQGVVISFNPALEPVETQSQSEQITLLKDMLIEAQRINQQQSWQLAQQTIDTTRKERREDLSALVDFLSEQRTQDQQLIKLQLNELAEQVEFQDRHTMANLLTGEHK